MLLFLLVLNDALANLSGLAYSVSEVVQLRSANYAVTDNFNLAKTRAVVSKGTLYAYAVRNAANGE